MLLLKSWIVTLSTAESLNKICTVKWELVFNIQCVWYVCLNLESYNLKLILFEFEIMLNYFILEKMCYFLNLINMGIV